MLSVLFLSLLICISNKFLLSTVYIFYFGWVSVTLEYAPLCNNPKASSLNPLLVHESRQQISPL
jgi:hypothetical protein